MNNRRAILLLVATGWWIIPLGCGPAGGPRPALGKVHGKISYQGKPLTKGAVIFVPNTGKGGEGGNSASGPIESDGSFELTTFNTGDGAVLGQHTAVIQAVSEGSSNEVMTKIPDFSGPNAYVPPRPLIPEKYTRAETSPLKYTVEKGENNFEITLKD